MKKIIFVLILSFVLIFINSYSIDEEVSDDEFNNFTGWVYIEFNPPIEVKAGHYYEIDYFNTTIREIN